MTTDHRALADILQPMIDEVDARSDELRVIYDARQNADRAYDAKIDAQCNLGKHVRFHWDAILAALRAAPGGVDAAAYRAGLEAAAQYSESLSHKHAGGKIIAFAIRSLPVPAAVEVTEAEVDAVVLAIVREVAELPDRTSPPDDETLMQVTMDELFGIVKAALRARSRP